MSKDEDEKTKGASIINFKEVTRGIEPIKYPEQSNDFNEDDLTVEEALEMGIDTFNDACLEEGTQGFISIIFDKNGASNIIHSGRLETISTLGALEYAKNQIININQQFPSYIEEYFRDDTED